MELILLVVIAGAVGYWLAGSRFRKPIDETTGKVVDSSRSIASDAEVWLDKTLKRGNKPENEIIDAEAKPVDEAKPAAKQSSRRRADDETAKD